MYPGGCPSCERGAIQIHTDTLLVHGMPGFVNGAEEGVRQVDLIHPGGDADIPQAKLGGEGMWGKILAAAVKIIAHRSDHFNTKIPLRLAGEMAAQAESSAGGRAVMAWTNGTRPWRSSANNARTLVAFMP